MPTDAELLQHYVEQRRQSAFTELVERHFELVYGAALRRTAGRGHLAAEIAQSVFSDLARKAATLRHHPTLVGWLYQSTRYAATVERRADFRRQKLAQSFATMSEPRSSPADHPVDWENLRPVIDAAMDQLKERDREIMLLRYFSGLSFAEVGIRLNLAENTARMRHERALEKLHGLLSSRGLTSTTAALSLVLSQAALASAPAGLALTVSAAALASASALGTAATVSLLMSKLTAPLLVTALASVLTVGLVSQHRKSARLEAAIAALQTERTTQDQKVQELTRLMSELLEIEKGSAVAIPAVAEVPSTPAAPVPADDANPAITKKAPTGWWKNGSKTDAYVVGVDRVNTLGGMPSAYVKSTTSSPEGFGGMMQSISAANYLGKRVRLSGWVKTENANDGGGHLWLRIDGKERDAMLGFDNMNGRAVKGTTTWQEYSVVLDVPKESAALAYGFFVEGTGQMWVSGTKMEEVSTDVPSTNRLTNPAKTLPKTPANLKFD